MTSRFVVLIPPERINPHFTLCVSSVASTSIQSTPLEDSFKFSFMRRGKAAAVATTKDGDQAAASTEPNVVHPYENSIKTVADVNTVEGFWSIYDYLKRPSELPTTTDYHFFRSHIKPTWEDKSNEKGGKWIIRLPKGEQASSQHGFCRKEFDIFH